jgi:hypothetical protein
MKEYQKLVERYTQAATAARFGDKAAHADKAKIMNEIRHVERSEAKAGRVLSRNVTLDGRVEVGAVEVDSKRSLQEEYVRKFDDEKIVKLGGAETTMRKYHAKRLLKK